MKLRNPPELFANQPWWATVLVISMYVILGPKFDDGKVHVSRPKLLTLQIFGLFSWIIVVGAVAYSLLKSFGLAGFFGAALSVVFSMMTTVLFHGRLLVNVLINCYQRRAPATVRMRCKQTPCCSEYFRLAVDEYGLWAGGRKGWQRMKRCDGTTNEDWP